MTLPVAMLHEIFPSDEGMFLWLGVLGALAYGAGAAATAGLLRVQRGRNRGRFYRIAVAIGLVIGFTVFQRFDRSMPALIAVVFPYVGLIATVVYALELQSPARSMRFNALLGGCVVSLAAVIGGIAALMMVF